jgi:hypothetical protein
MLSSIGKVHKVDKMEIGEMSTFGWQPQGISTDGN